MGVGVWPGAQFSCLQTCGISNYQLPIVHTDVAALNEGFPNLDAFFELGQPVANGRFYDNCE